MIHVLWNVWQEADVLPASVAAASAAIDGPVSHVFVDGRYPTFPGADSFSTDGTIQFAATTGTLVLTCADECSKRTVGMRAIDATAAPGDYVLVLDADEELTAFTVPASRVGLVAFRRDSDGATYDRARVLAWEPGMIFARRHLDVYDHAGRLVAGLAWAPDATECAAGVHHDRRRPDRAEAKDAYYRWLQDHEAVTA